MSRKKDDFERKFDMICEFCDVQMKGLSWKAHIQGKKHRNNLDKLSSRVKQVACVACCKLIPLYKWPDHRKENNHAILYSFMRQKNIDVPESQKPLLPQSSKRTESSTTGPPIRKCSTCNINVLMAAWDNHIASLPHLEKAGKRAPPPTSPRFRRCDDCKVNCSIGTWNTHLTSTIHLRNVANALPKVHCGTCMKEFLMQDWPSHERQHGSSVSHRISCPICSTVSRSVDQWTDHLGDKKHLDCLERLNVKTRYCDSCHFNVVPAHWRSHISTRQHIVASIPAQVKCMACEKVLSLSLWEQHTLSAHDEAPRCEVRCLLCQRKFKAVTGWTGHLASEKHRQHVNRFRDIGVSIQSCRVCKFDVFQQEYKWHKRTWRHWAAEAERDPKRRPLLVEELVE